MRHQQNAGHRHVPVPLKLDMKIIQSITNSRIARKTLLVSGLVAASLSLTACYVVPMNSQVPSPSPVVVAPAISSSSTFTARLYPANEQAREAGMAVASVTNDMNGHGTFSTVIQGESFTGEATRKNASSREGQANGIGTRGNYLQCTYNMNSPTQGSGTCRHSNGAIFTMHLGG
jgi:hypothetical protein